MRSDRHQNHQDICITNKGLKPPALFIVEGSDILEYSATQPHSPLSGWIAQPFTELSSFNYHIPLQSLGKNLITVSAHWGLNINENTKQILKNKRASQRRLTHRCRKGNANPSLGTVRVPPSLPAAIFQALLHKGALSMTILTLSSIYVTLTECLFEQFLPSAERGAGLCSQGQQIVCSLHTVDQTQNWHLTHLWKHQQTTTIFNLVTSTILCNYQCR